MAELDPFDLEVDRFELRVQQIQASAEFGATYIDELTGETHSYAALAPAALASQEQLELTLTGYSVREAIRRALADRIERLPSCESWLAKYPTRLRTARQSGKVGIRLATGKRVFFWDHKAGLARLCPDDAREEAMRLRRRINPIHEALRASGHRFLYAVFTLPNSAAGELREGMDAAFARLRRLLSAKDGDGDARFPQIKGAVAVLEAPLGRSRDWNVHLNVILPVKGFLDFGELRKQWHWNVEMRWIPDAPGAFQGAFAELIKYAVAATVAKSAEHAASGKSRAPPMLEWTDGELLEWLRAMKGFRRTRTYGALYGAPPLEKEDLGPILWIGTVSFSGDRYRCRLPLLGSIPEDKFTGLSATERWQALVRALAPDGLVGASSLGESDAVRSSTRQLKNL